MQGFLGSIDANTGDLLLGWDTDQFPTDIYLTTQCMLSILKYGGLAPGGINFDAKVRRESFEPVDLFHAHIGGMDAFARGLKIAAAIRADGKFDAFVKERYGSWDSGVGADIERGRTLGGGAGRAPGGDQRATQAGPLERRQNRGQAVQFGHAVGLWSLEAHDDHRIGGKLAGREGVLHVLLIVEPPDRGFDGV